MGANPKYALYGVHAKDDVWRACSSGGAFFAICESMVARGYAVYGAAYVDGLRVAHLRATTLRECERLRKSKYVQSDLGDSYELVATDLRDGIGVCFSGTPCQCAGLRSFLRMRKVDAGKLVVVDLLCHGVPNQMLFDAHVRELSASSGEELVGYSFKNKSPICGRVNTRTCEQLYASGRREVRTARRDMYLKGYYERLFYRPSCYECKFACGTRVGDITLGDAWGIESIDRKLDPEAGISLLLANTDVGYEVLGDLRSMELHELPVGWAIESQDILQRPTRAHPNRAVFFGLWPDVGFRKAVSISTHRSLARRIIGRIRRVVGA